MMLISKKGNGNSGSGSALTGHLQSPSDSTHSSPIKNEGKSAESPPGDIHLSENKVLILAMILGKLASMPQDGQKLQQERIGNSTTSPSGQSELAKKHCGICQNGTDTSRAELSRVVSMITQLSNSQKTHEHNLDQIRLLCESSARKMERLTEDFIQHQVTDQLFKEFVRTYGSLYSLGNGRKSRLLDEIKVIAEKIKNFMESYESEIINPDKGDRFDPKYHQPIKKRTCKIKAFHGRIACTYHPGLMRNGRIIQTAKVEVFSCKDIEIPN